MEVTSPPILRLGETFYVPEPLHPDHRGLAVEVVPVPDEAAIERLARYLAEKRWATWLHPYQWDEVTEGHRDAYRRDALAVLRAALEDEQ